MSAILDSVELIQMGLAQNPLEAVMFKNTQYLCFSLWNNTVIVDIISEKVLFLGGLIHSS
jgi:hypothetical protein